MKNKNIILLVLNARRIKMNEIRHCVNYFLAAVTKGIKQKGERREPVHHT